MASAIFEGTSLVNMFVKDCWVNGIRRLIIRGDEEEFFEIRTEWSDRNILYLHRSSSDLGRLLKRLLECFPEDRRDLSKCPLIVGGCEVLLWIKCSSTLPTLFYSILFVLTCYHLCWLLLSLHFKRANWYFYSDVSSSNPFLTSEIAKLLINFYLFNSTMLSCSSQLNYSCLLYTLYHSII